MTDTTKGWSEKRRQEQAKRCRETKPWTKSTGPKTDTGKALVKTNALKHGLRSQAGNELETLLALQQKFVSILEAVLEDKTDDHPKGSLSISDDK